MKMLGGSGNSFYFGEGGELGIPNLELCKATLNLYLPYTNYLLLVLGIYLSDKCRGRLQGSTV